jgi:hypothetical protein
MPEQAIGGVFFILVALGLSVLTALALYEAYVLLFNRAPITWFARLGIADHPRFSFIIAFDVGLLLGHLFWR